MKLMWEKNLDIIYIVLLNYTKKILYEIIQKLCIISNKLAAISKIIKTQLRSIMK